MFGFEDGEAAQFFGVGCAEAFAVGAQLGLVGAEQFRGQQVGALQPLGLKPDLVAKAVPIVLKYVGKTGGTDVASLLAGVLK